VLPKSTPRLVLIRKFKTLGWDGPFGRGKHPVMTKGTRTQTIPNAHQGDIDISLLKRILRQAEITDKQWNDA